MYEQMSSNPYTNNITNKGWIDHSTGLIYKHATHTSRVCYVQFNSMNTNRSTITVISKYVQKRCTLIQAHTENCTTSDVHRHTSQPH